MKKVPLLITCGIVLLLAGGYYTYHHFTTRESVKPWDLVPADAVIVYEKNDCNACIDQIGTSMIWRIVETASFYNKRGVDSLKHKLRTLIIQQPEFIASLHNTKKDEFDLVYFINGTTRINTDFLKTIAHKRSNREFNAINIEEYTVANQTFSLALIEEVWVGSFTPFLIEDVIRTYKADGKNGFSKKAANAQSFSSIKNDAGNLYVNFRNFSEWLTLFYPQFPAHTQIATSALLDIKANNTNVVLNGFTFDSTGNSKNLLSVFRNQSPVPFGLKHLVSNRTTALSSYGISDGTAFHTNLGEFVMQKRPSLPDTLDKIASRNKLDFASLYNSISDELGVCFLESKNNRLSKILIVETAAPQVWIKTFNAISEKLSIDTVFFEKYSDFEIREVPVYKFTEKLLWPLVSGFAQNFYTSIGNYILIADNLEELKNFLDDFESEETWGKSVGQNQFLESTLLESNMSLYVNSGRLWNVLTGDFNPRWQNFVRENKTLMQSLQMSAFQFSHLNNNYYTNVVFTFRPQLGTPVTKASSEKITTNFERGIHKLHAVKSHVNRSNEVLVQDSVNDLSLISSDGKVLWKISIGDRITSDVSQIDFFRNGKLQYFFATQDAIHIIDRLGNYVDPYPVYIPKVRIEFASVIDYDNSKKYRFLVSDEKGRLWMFDKEGNNLEGWRPKDVGSALAMAPRHYRIKGKDYLLAIRKDGYVFLMNRRGENLRRFPMNAEAIPLGDHFLERTNSISDTYFVIVSRDGFRIKFNIEGKIQSRETLLKNSINSTFGLICEKSNKSYLILQQDGKVLTLSDELGRKVISENFPLINPADIKYFDFGAGKIFITITDRTQGFSYVFDGQGNLLISPPLSGSAIEIRPVNSEHFRVFFIHNKTLAIQSL